MCRKTQSNKSPSVKTVLLQFLFYYSTSRPKKQIILQSTYPLVLTHPRINKYPHRFPSVLLLLEVFVHVGFPTDLLDAKPVIFSDDRLVMPFDEILRLVTAVFHAFVSEEVDRYSFLTQDIPAILLIAEYAEDATGTPCGQTLHRWDFVLG